MGRFTWSTENEVFLAPVDAEHRGLFRFADELQVAIAKSAPPDAICEHLHRLEEYMAEHFSHEEELMREVGYLSYGWHRAQHDTARRRLKLLVPLIETGDIQAAELCLEFLAGWLHDHTTLTDKMMTAFVRNYERTRAARSVDRREKALAVPASSASSITPAASQAAPPPPTGRDLRNRRN